MKNKFDFRDKAMDIAIALIFALAVFICIIIYQVPGTRSVTPSMSPFLFMMPESITESEIKDYAGIKRSYGNGVHVGLVNVKERLKIMCGGKLSIGFRPGGGNIITIFIPG